MLILYLILTGKSGDNKSDEAIVNRIHKLVNNIQSQNLSKEINMNIDYLNEVYQLFKKWH